MKNKTNLEIRNMFEKISEKYDFMNRIISFGLNEYVKTQAIKALNIKPNSKVLDLCCGSGDLGKIIKKLQPSCDVIGVDFSQNMIELASKKNPNITYRQMDVTSLAFEKNSFDYIVMGFGLRNIPQKNKALEEIYRTLKTEGQFLHIDFGKHNIYSKIYDSIILFLVKFFTKNTKPYKYLILSKRNFLEPEELIELFKFNKLKYIKHKNMLFDVISFQILKKTEIK